MASAEVSFRPGDSTTTLLAERERRILRASMLARIGLLVIIMVLVAIVAGRTSEKIWMGFVFGAYVAACAWAVRALDRRRTRLELLSRVGLASDLALLVLLPILWHAVYTEPREPLVHLTRHNYTAACALLIAFNVPTLRPNYTAIISATAVVGHVSLAVLATTDPRLADYTGGLPGALGVGMSAVDMLVVTPFLLALAGGVLTWATANIRRTFVEAVQLEVAQRELEARQVEAVLDARLTALGELVAGLEHEVNNPLGALQSARDTASRSAAKVRATLGEGSAEVDRPLRALDASLALVRDASDRVHDVMATIKGFVQLDRGDHQRVDLTPVVTEVLVLVKRSLREDTTVTTALEPDLQVDGNARRLSQALLTIVQNATEALDGPGEVQIETRSGDGRATIEVRDTGRGMSPDQVATLFDIGFAESSRVRARFGLPMVKSIMHRHGGEVSVDSEVGRGTTVRLSLPLAANLAS